MPEPVVVLWLCLWLWLCFVFVAKLVAVLVFVAVFGAGACGCGCANWNLVPKYDEHLQWATCFGLNVYALLGRLSGFGVQQFERPVAAVTSGCACALCLWLCFVFAVLFVIVPSAFAVGCACWNLLPQNH